MHKLITYITGKELMERWGMDGYKVWQIMKKAIPIPDDEETIKQLIVGSFNTQVEFAKLLLEDDKPKDLYNKMASFQFALSEIEVFENKPNFRKDISSPIVDINTPRDAEIKLSPDQKDRIEKYDLELLRDITVCHDKDKNEIKIRMPKGKFKKYDYGQDLKFSVVRKKRKELDKFIEIISQSPFIFYAGKKKKNPTFTMQTKNFYPALTKNYYYFLMVIWN